MKKILIIKLRRIGYILFIFNLLSCNPSANQKVDKMNENYTKPKPGSYGYDLTFFREQNIATVELSDSSSNACVLVIPAYQGRVMTSSADGKEGLSFGWIYYDYIKSGQHSDQFNPYGGEERLWLGPEGGPFSIYFRQGEEQIFKNWKVPAELDTKPYDIVECDKQKISFHKVFSLQNYRGTSLDVGIDRKVKLLSKNEINEALKVSIPGSLNCVAYESENTLTNLGKINWNKDNGVLSIWMLSMFNPSPQGIVFIPYKEGNEMKQDKIVNDDYFGKVPEDRLIIKDGLVFFKTDGKLRSKIGMPPQRALPLCGSYDPQNKALTLLWCSLHEEAAEYVNSKWGEQNDPLNGDAINSYNDGPNDTGETMGPFYEIESSSPAAKLASGESITHTQRIYHIVGEEDKLSLITQQLFNVSINEIKEIF